MLTIQKVISQSLGNDCFEIVRGADNILFESFNHYQSIIGAHFTISVITGS